MGFDGHDGKKRFMSPKDNFKKVKITCPFTFFGTASEKMFRMFSYLTKLIKHNSYIPGGELTTHYSMPKFGTQIVETFD